MEAGHPLTLSQLLPFGLGVNDALIVALSLGVFLVIWSIGSYFIERDRNGVWRGTCC